MRICVLIGPNSLLSAQIDCSSPVESEELKLEVLFMQKETKAVLQAIDIASRLKATPMLSSKFNRITTTSWPREPAKHCSPLDLFPWGISTS